MDAHEPTTRRRPDLLAFAAALAALVLLVAAFAAVAAVNDPDDDVAASAPDDGRDDDAGAGSGGLVGEVRATDDHAHDGDDHGHDSAAHEGDDHEGDDHAHDSDDHGHDSDGHAHGPTAQPASAPAPTTPGTVAPATDCPGTAATTTTTTTTTTTVPHHDDGHHHLVTGPAASPVALLATAACDPAATGATTTTTPPTTAPPTTTPPTTAPPVDPCRQWDGHHDHDGDAHEDGPPVQFTDLALCYPEVAYQVAVATDWAIKHPTTRDARAAGFFQQTKFFPGIAAHYINGALMDSVFDPIRPEVLLYSDDGKLVGFNYIVHSGDEPPDGFEGTWDSWHEHQYLCWDGLVVGESTTPDGCPPGTATIDFRGRWLLHVWTIPGWDSPEGIFSHENPRVVELNDGD